MTQREPQPGDRYIVVRVSEADIRSLIYARGADAEITVTNDAKEFILGPEQLRDLGMWDEAKVLAVDLNKPPADLCHAWFGDRVAGGEKCLRAVGHPAEDVDGIGHSASARYQRL